MWWKNTERGLPVQIELDLKEIVYFRLALFASFQDMRAARQPAACGHQISRPQVPVYPGRFSFAGANAK
ncbi:MAG: hypothetical protein QME75_10880 [Deltaproteobacteria bacterium]|nr:hypothetical protein [Deltaproteobacteria bacterium]